MSSRRALPPVTASTRASPGSHRTTSHDPDELETVLSKKKFREKNIIPWRPLWRGVILEELFLCEIDKVKQWKSILWNATKQLFEEKTVYFQF